MNNWWLVEFLLWLMHPLFELLPSLSHCVASCFSFFFVLFVLIASFMFFFLFVCFFFVFVMRMVVHRCDRSGKINCMHMYYYYSPLTVIVRLAVALFSGPLATHKYWPASSVVTENTIRVPFGNTFCRWCNGRGRPPENEMSRMQTSLSLVKFWTRCMFVCM